MLSSCSTGLPRAREAAIAALETLRSKVLVDGYPIVLDLQRSRGSYLHDAKTGRDYLDFYSFFASQPIGLNHPRMGEPEFQERLLLAATTKVTNPDICTAFYADLVATMSRVVGLPGFDHYFFIDGGTLAVENALKAAFDWKVRKNVAAGRGEIGHSVIHFRQAFHGRSGYTLSLTNTSDPRKTQYFPKFDWPRVDNPKLDFTLDPAARIADVEKRERGAVLQIERALAQHPHEIAALIIEPIQGEGGDNHFRGEFFHKLRELADRHDFLLIFDEVQCGVGLTGRMWCCQHFDVLPDILCFGKKMQICGIMANRRVDEVDSVFKISSRINSTFGGNLADMVRAVQYLNIIEDEKLVERAADSGRYLQEQLVELARRHSALISAPRGRGLMCAFDLPTPQIRDAVKKACWEQGMIVLASGERSIRFRPVLDVERPVLDEGVRILDEVARQVAGAG